MKSRIYNENITKGDKSSWRNRLARSTVNREVVGSIPTEDASFTFFVNYPCLCYYAHLLYPVDALEIKSGIRPVDG